MRRSPEQAVIIATGDGQRKLRRRFLDFRDTVEEWRHDTRRPLDEEINEIEVEEDSNVFALHQVLQEILLLFEAVLKISWSIINFGNAVVFYVSVTLNFWILWNV